MCLPLRQWMAAEGSFEPNPQSLELGRIELVKWTAINGDVFKRWSKSPTPKMRYVI